ncbi:MAG: DUF5591 domain-containing protein [Thermoplasmata archaeon]|nr:DUF5591 domain-containing protein [Thermoplasmata archaeon]
MRTVLRVAGLSLAGTVTIGPLSFPVPAVAGSRGSEGGPANRPDGSVLLTSPADAALGRRRVALETAGSRWDLEFAVPAPEVSGIAGAADLAAPGSWVIHWPLTPDQWETIHASKPTLVVLGNARTLFAEGEAFALAIRDIRERLGGAPAVWAPRIALPHRLAFLTYAGIDLLDTTEALWRAHNGIYLDETLGELDRTASLGRCACRHCLGVEPDVGFHVRHVFRREGALVAAAIRAGRLRELVEARLTAEPALAELLRYADRAWAQLLDQRTPVVGLGKLGYVLRESQRRPEVTRFLQRLEERYRPPASKELLLVLPCSKTKPYRASPSHRRYWRALENLGRLDRVHVASVTAPLGVVPRELEDVYPARHYDIPVTGEWDEAERAAVVRCLSHLIRNGGYRSVICHLDPVEYGFLRSALPDSLPSVWTSGDDRTLSPPALDAMRRAVEGALCSLPSRGSGPLFTVREELREVAAFQFGRAAADLLFAEPARLMGRPWFQRLTDGRHTDLATWREERGLFQLTAAGGQRMLPAHPLEVEVGEGLTLSGDLFTPGVVRADRQIRSGDAVLLTRGGTLLAVGEAELPGPLMVELPHGRAVTVRHRVRPGTTH